MRDEENKQATSQASMGMVDMSWHDQQQRELALIKAVEARTHGEDDHAILARAGRFLNFLKTGS